MRSREVQFEYGVPEIILGLAIIDTGMLGLISQIFLIVEEQVQRCRRSMYQEFPCGSARDTQTRSMRLVPSARDESWGMRGDFETLA